MTGRRGAGIILVCRHHCQEARQEFSASVALGSLYKIQALLNEALLPPMHRHHFH